MAFRQNTKNTYNNGGLFAIDRFMIFKKNYSSIDNQQLHSALKIYPSPATDVIRIQLPEAIKEIEIVSSNGKIAKSIDNLSSTFVEVDIQDLLTGVYFVRVRTSNSVLNKKIIVK